MIGFPPRPILEIDGHNTTMILLCEHISGEKFQTLQRN